MTTVRFWRTLMRQVLLGIVAGAFAQGDSQNHAEQVLEVYMGWGGNCSGITDPDFPCWYKTLVFAAKIHLETPQTTLESAIDPAEFQQVVEIVNRPDFRSAITAKEPTCPVVFDSACSLTLSTSTGTFTDKYASGCILYDESVPIHSYRDLFHVLDQMRKSHFPGAMPF